MRILTCVLCLAFGVVSGRADGAAAVQALQLAQQAATLLEARDYAAAAEKLEAAIGLRPDFPQLHLDLAAARAGAGQEAEALASLGTYGRFGLYSPVERAPEFAGLRSRSGFQDLVKRIAANQHPKGSGEVAFSLRDVTGLIEGIAWREKTGEFLFGDVNARAVWARRKDGALRRLTPDDDTLFGVFGLVVDEAAGALWAATSAVPAMRGFSPELSGQAALAEIDLESGAVRRVLPIPRAAGSEAGHQLTDLSMGEDGTVWAVDAGTPVLWRLPAGGGGLERAVESPEFFTLQAVVALPGGVLLVADQVNGLLRVDPARREARQLPPPPHVTLGDLNSLTLAPDGSVLALQSGVRPNRVLRIELEPDAEGVARVAVVESGHLAMGAPSLGCLGSQGDFYFVGNAGWSRFQSGDGAPTAPRLVPVFRSKLPKARR